MGAVSLLSALVFSTGAFAAANSAKSNCFPIKGQMFLQSLEATISDEDGAQIRQQLSAVYSQDLAARGESLNIFEEDDMDFQGFAFVGPGTNVASVQIYKGVRFNPQMNPDGYALVTCHEIGHHLGGVPMRALSLEGEADYFGALKCMRRYLGSLSSTALYSEKPAMPLIARCQASFRNADDVQICARSLAAAQTLGGILKDLSHESSAPSLDKSDPKVVLVTDTGHPASQCRVDTYRAGALCTVAVSEENSDTDYDAGVCNLHRDPADRRPACWFADPSAPILASAQ
jgi:hypothetical protein